MDISKSFETFCTVILTSSCQIISQKDAFVITVAEEQDGQWVNTKTRGVYAGYYYEEDYDRHGGCPDTFISTSINCANREIVGL